jgi:hypothetical protein
MMPVLEGIIARRVLLNFRADPEVVRRLVPKPLEIVTLNDAAIVGVCLIRLERLRPKGLPEIAGLCSENMAHRVAVRYPTAEGMRDAVYIWRRETDLTLATFLGGRLFPGVHQCAKFYVAQDAGSLEMEVRTRRREADVWFAARLGRAWEPTASFARLEDAAEFFRSGDCGFSCALRGRRLEGMRLRTLRWEMEPLRVEEVHATFFADERRFPRASAQFDCGLLMRGLPHEWHALDEVPELAAAGYLA